MRPSSGSWCATSSKGVPGRPELAACRTAAQAQAGAGRQPNRGIPVTQAHDDWNAAQYTQHSSLQEAMAAEVLALLVLRGDERVLDVGCGDGRITAQIADRVSSGSVLGVDASADMIAHASRQYGPGAPQARANLRFEVADARALGFNAAFDCLVSFNALHWVHEQASALVGIAAALAPAGRAQLRLVTRGPATSLEEVAEATRKLPRWAAHFEAFEDPYLRLTADQYAALAVQCGLRVLAVHTAAKAWNFRTDEAFFGFCNAGFGAWTQRLPEAQRRGFVEAVIRAYRVAKHDGPDEANTFRFYQSDITLAKRAR